MLLLFGVAQLVPYRITNPSTNDEPSWTSATGRQLVVESCYDCHSNQTSSHWYTKVAPLSWWTANHVKQGRAALNFSEWSTTRHRRNLAGSVAEGGMPPSYYTWFGRHANAKLTTAQKTQLMDELRAVAAQG